MNQTLQLVVDHSRGLCGKSDRGNTLPCEEAEANPPNCLCCGSPMKVVDCDSSGMNELGMYWLICPLCSNHHSKKVP
jgi:hypothetical protein